MKKYVVTLQDIKDKEEFCDQMEKSLTGASKGFVPQRSCDCVIKAKMGRNSTYVLSEEEAENLKNDSRIKSVELSCEQIPGLRVGPAIFKPDSENPIRSLKDDFQSQDLGDKNFTFQDMGDKYATISNVPSGINVDVVIVDNHVTPNHPEFAQNGDGTGGTRFNSFNWNIYNNDVWGYGDTDVVYDYSVHGSESHGTHVAGIVAGNSQGWAKKANIYHIRYETFFWAHYIRVFHRKKSINPATGIKNPTIINNSWGYQYDLNDQNMNNIVSVTYRGVTINRPANGQWNWQDLLTMGIVTRTNNHLTTISGSDSSINADVEDMVADGIVVVASAANNYSKCDLVGGIDYNNYFTLNYNGDPNNQYDYYYQQGGSPAASESAISVGSIKSLKINGLEYKTDYSNCGPNVDVYAPGDAIISSVLGIESGSVADPRSGFQFGSPIYGLAKFTGTSMAGPQVAGMLACIASTNPSLNQATAKSYISTNAKSTIADTNGDSGDFQSLQGSPNKYLYYAGASVTYP